VPELTTEVTRPTTHGAWEDRSVDGSDLQRHNSMSFNIFQPEMYRFQHRILGMLRKDFNFIGKEMGPTK